MDRKVVTLKRLNKMTVQTAIIILFLAMFFVNGAVFVFTTLGLAEGGMSNNTIFNILNNIESMNENDAKKYLTETKTPHYDLSDEVEFKKIPKEYLGNSDRDFRYLPINKNIYYKFSDKILIRFPIDIQFVGPFREIIPFPIVGILIILFCLTYFHYKYREKSLNKTIGREFIRISELLEIDYKTEFEKYDPRFETVEFKKIGDHIYDSKKLIFEKTMQELEYKEQKTKQLGELAHDIKTPLTIIQGNIELLLESKDQEEIQKRMTRIEKQINRMLDDINRMLLMVRLENHDENKKEIYEISQCTEYLTISIENFLEPCGINYTIYNEIDGNSGTKINISYDYIERAVMNLVKNCIENSNSLIEIIFKVQNRQYIISIVDDGPGFPNEVLNRMHGDSNENPANGFGLEFVKRVMKIHGGRLDISNKSYKGASCILVLPVYD